MVMVAVRGAVPSILIWKVSPARKVVWLVRSTDWLSVDGAARQAQRVQHAGAVGIDRQARAGGLAVGAADTAGSIARCHWRSSAVAKALLTFCTLRCWPGEGAGGGAGEIDRAVRTPP